jgi:choline-sulfatase
MSGTGLDGGRLDLGYPRRYRTMHCSRPSLSNLLILLVAWLAVLSGLPGCDEQAPFADEPAELPHEPAGLVPEPTASAAAPSVPSNLLLITVDTLRADHLSFYGYDRDTTPGVAGWIGEAALFERFYTPLPLTDPAFSSMMTGLAPIRHGVRHTSRRLDGSIATLAEVLRSHGWDTAAFVSRGGLMRGGNLDRGFDVANFEGGDPDALGLSGARAKAEVWQRRAKDVTDIALLWIWKRAEPPFFVWLHYYDPHAFYDALPPFRDRFEPSRDADSPPGLRAWWGSDIDGAQAIADYDEEILVVDQQIMRVVDHLRLTDRWDSTLVVLTSDHGESLGERGHMDHGEWLYEEQLRVPLVLRHPQLISPGARIREPVQMVDLAPTLLDLLGVEGEDVDRFVTTADGRSVRPLLEGGELPSRPLFFESENCPDEAGRENAPGMICYPAGVDGKIRALSDGRWKLILTPLEEARKFELYDLETDPLERIDRSESEPARVRRMTAQLDAYWQAKAPAAVLDAEVQERLRALGYGE